MHIKRPNFDFTVQTKTSTVLWVDLIVCGCVALVQLSRAQTKYCLNKSIDCSFYYYISESLLANVVVGLIALYGVRHQKPTLLFPFTLFKSLFIITMAFLMIFWTQLTSTNSTSEFHKWLARIDTSSAIAFFIIFVFQFYAIFVMIWSYKKTVQMLRACPPNKSFKSVISIWIGDDSRTNIHSNDSSTCIIETESR